MEQKKQKRLAIKASEKNISQEAVQKTIKMKTAVGNQRIAVDDVEEEEEEDFSYLESSSKVKKKKHLGKQKDPGRKGAMKKKKRKKVPELRNRACANLPIIIESGSDSESLTNSRKIPEMVKRKEGGRHSCEREGDFDVAYEGLPAEQQGANCLIRQARKRAISASNQDSVTLITKQQKKKKMGKRERHEHICPLRLRIRVTEDEFPKGISLNPKVISQDTVFSGREKGGMSVQNSTGDIVQKKKAAFCLKLVDSQEGRNELLEEVIASRVGQFDKGKHCKRRTLGCEQQQEDEMQVSEEETDTVAKKRRKKKKKPEKEKAGLFLTSASSQKNSSGVSNDNSLKPKSKKKMLIVADQMDPIPNADGDGNVTKKNKIQTKGGSNGLSLLKDRKDERRKKKERKLKVLQVPTASGYDGKVEKKKKKKKKKRKDRESGELQKHTEGESSLKKATLKKEGKELEDEIIVVAFKKGNCDEVNIDKLRRQALQEEIDRESGKTQVIKEEKESDNCFGQWGTAAFENSERKAKFLRLLGGFKKASSVPAQNYPEDATKLNMALDGSKEEKLHRNLEAEFEKAVHWKHHRGVGLGFQAAAQKHTHIDKYTSKSIKFED